MRQPTVPGASRMRSVVPAVDLVTDAGPLAQSRAVATEVARRRASGPGRRWTESYVLLVALMAVLSLIGLVMVLSASSIDSLRQFHSPWHYFERQLLWLVLGAGAFAVSVRIDYRWWRRLGPVAVGGAILLLLAVMVPGIGISAGGSARWLGRGSWRLQPSELCKPALIIFAADIADRRADRIARVALQHVPGPGRFRRHGGAGHGPARHGHHHGDGRDRDRRALRRRCTASGPVRPGARARPARPWSWPWPLRTGGGE